MEYFKINQIFRLANSYYKKCISEDQTSKRSDKETADLERTICNSCGVLNQYGDEFRYVKDLAIYLCDDCYDSKYQICQRCYENVPIERIGVDRTGLNTCSKCR